MKNIKRAAFIGLVAVVLWSMASTTTFAKHSKGSHQEESLSEKVEHKAKKIISTQDESGLTDEQIDRVKQIKYETKKQVIGNEAEIELLKTDIWHEIYRRPADLDKINQLIDQKYEVKKANSKMLAGAYVTLKEIPTDEQWKKIKAAYRK
jgi:Spy/CpxP family protein refolding chaperone